MVHVKLKGILAKLKILTSNHSIHFELLAVLILMSFLPSIFINVFYYNKLNHFIEEKMVVYNQEIVSQMADKLDSVLDQVYISRRQLITNTVASSGLIESYFSKSRSEQIDILRKTEALLEGIKTSYPSISDVYLIEPDGIIFTSRSLVDRERLLQKDWIKNIGSFEYGDFVIPVHNADYYDISEKDKNWQVITFATKIITINNENRIQLVQIDLKYDEIKKITKSFNINDTDFAFIIDENNKIVYFPEDKYLGGDLYQINYRGVNAQNTGGFSNGNKQNGLLVFNSAVNHSGWRVVAVVSTKNVMMQYDEAKKLTIYITIVLILFSVLISFFIARGITKPINRIIKKMKLISMGVFEKIPVETRNKDMLVLSNSLNYMVDEIDLLIKSGVEKEKEKTNAQINALQAQINPHFLYNTLEVVRSIALEHDITSIDEIAMSMANILRYNINKEKEIVTLREEINHARDYVSIQKQRYEDKLDVIFEIKEEIAEMKTIRFILQPLVENAIFHGIEMKMSNGTILVKARIINEKIVIKVIDNGIGITPDRIHMLNKALKNVDSQKSCEQSEMGIGILNVNTRIKLHYGNEYGLRIKSKLNVGTIVQLTIPVVVRGSAK